MLTGTYAEFVALQIDLGPTPLVDTRPVATASRASRLLAMSGVHPSHDGRIVRRGVRVGDGRGRIGASSVAMEHEAATVRASARWPLSFWRPGLSTWTTAATGGRCPA
jgi:hypothetical protein